MYTDIISHKRMIRITLERAEQGHPGRYRRPQRCVYNSTDPTTYIQAFHQSRIADASLQSEAAQFFSPGAAPQAFDLSGLSAALPLQQTPAIAHQPSREAPWGLPIRAVQQHDAAMQGWTTEFLAAEEQRAKSPIGAQLVQGPMLITNVPQRCAFLSYTFPKNDDFY